MGEGDPSSASRRIRDDNILEEQRGAEVAIRRGIADLMDNCFRESPLLLPHNHLIAMSFRVPLRRDEESPGIIVNSFIISISPHIPFCPSPVFRLL